MAATTGTSPASSDQRTETLRCIGRYQVIQQIGRGGQGVVYQARDTVLGREVAIKELLPQRPTLGERLDPDEIAEARQRLMREARAASNLDHPNIVALLEFIEQDEEDEKEKSLYLVMPFVAGGSLGARIKAKISLTTGNAAGIVRQIAAALDYAHEKGIFHRDIKPDNILVSDDRLLDRWLVKVTDFGAARIISQSVSTTFGGLGTLTHTAPERFAGSKGDAKTDQFSLGVLAYQLFGRRLPFTALEPQALMSKIVSDEPASLLKGNPDLPSEVDDVIRKALAKAPERRFKNCGAFAEALERALWPSEATTRRTFAAKSASFEGLSEGEAMVGRARDLIQSGHARMEEQDFRAAEGMFEAALQSLPPDEDQLRGEANGRLISARKAFEAEQRLAALLSQAREAIGLGDLLVAARHMAEAEELAPSNCEIVALRLEIQAETQRRAEAETLRVEQIGSERSIAEVARGVRGHVDSGRF